MTKKILLTLVVMIALASGGYFGLRFITDKVNYSVLKVKESGAEIKQLQNRLDQLQNGMQVLQNDVQKINAAKDKNWQPIIIEHLVRMADLTLNTTGEVKLTLSFLTRAEQYASAPELSVINHALNKDIAALQVVPVVDAEELTLKLESLNQKIGVMPLVAQEFVGPAAATAKPEAISYAKNLWGRIFASSVTALKNIVTIRRQTVEPLLSSEQEALLRLDLQTKLLQAQLAVVHRQNKLYQSCLVQVTTLINRYFVANNIVKSDILPVLQELQQVDLQPKLPTLTESIAAIINNREPQKVIVAKSPEEK